LARPSSWYCSPCARCPPTSNAASNRSPARGADDACWRGSPARPGAVHDALGIAFSLIRERKPWLIGAIAYWGFDIATLWTCFHAFGSPPTVAVIVMAYFVGALANALPLPGGLGGVEAGMIGVFLAFGTHASLAILAVLSYRLISFWLPTLPGAAAYLQLRRTVGLWRDETNSESQQPAGAVGEPS